MVFVYSMHNIGIWILHQKKGNPSWINNKISYTKRSKASKFLQQVNSIVSRHNDRNQCPAPGYILVPYLRLVMATGWGMRI